MREYVDCDLRVKCSLRIGAGPNTTLPSFLYLFSLEIYNPSAMAKEDNAERKFDSFKVLMIIQNATEVDLLARQSTLFSSYEAHQACSLVVQFLFQLPCRN